MGVAVPGGVEHLGLSARTIHEMDNRLVTPDFPKYFFTVKMSAVLAEVANCVSSRTPLVGKCYDVVQDQLPRYFGRTPGRPDRSLPPAVSSRGGPVGPEILWLVLRPGLKCLRYEIEGKGMDAFAYMDNISLSLMVATTANTVRGFTLLRRDLNDIGMVVNPVSRPWHYH